jgi:hypothetical protein
MPDDLKVPELADITDLFVRGAELEVTDPETGRISRNWLQKLNPVEQQRAVRKANAARARFLAARFEEDSEEYLSVVNHVESLSRDEQIEVLLNIERIKLFDLKSSQLSFEDPWKDGYLDGLRDLWNGGLETTFSENPEDEEAKRVQGQLMKFRDEVLVLVEEDLDVYRGAYSEKSAAVLRHDVVEFLFKGISDGVWEDEYNRCYVWLGTRNITDHAKSTFATREAVDMLQAESIAVLEAGFRKLVVSPQEGKDSPVDPASSN